MVAVIRIHNSARLAALRSDLLSQAAGLGRIRSIVLCAIQDERCGVDVLRKRENRTRAKRFVTPTSLFLEGTANAYLTLRVGVICRTYCASLAAFDRKRARRFASVTAAGMLGSIVSASAARVAKAILVAAKNAGVSTIERQRPEFAAPACGSIRSGLVSRVNHRPDGSLDSQ